MRLETSRLILRAPTKRDVDRLFSVAKDPHISRYMPLPRPYTRKSAEGFLNLYRRTKKAGSGHHLLLVRKEDRQIIGCASLFRLEPHHKNAEIGYWLGPPYWGHGYASEAARRLVDYGFNQLGLQKIYGITLPGNKASSHVLKKLGFKPEGRFRRHFKLRGRYQDLEYWGLLRGER